MTDRPDHEVDALLAALAEAERSARPLPDPALTARVLSDAAAVGSARAAPPRRRWTGWPARIGLLVPLPAAAMTAAAVLLLLGVGLGYQIEPDPVGLADGLILAGADDPALADFPL